MYYLAHVFARVKGPDFNLPVMFWGVKGPDVKLPVMSYLGKRS